MNRSDMDQLLWNLQAIKEEWGRTYFPGGTPACVAEALCDGLGRVHHCTCPFCQHTLSPDTVSDHLCNLMPSR